MTKFTDGDPLDLKANQYGSSNNLESRIRLHRDFTVDQADWHEWAFGRLLEEVDTEVEEVSILELGCGTGELWIKNKDRIPSSWQLSLTDFSSGMVSDAKNRLALLVAAASFGELDIDQDSITGSYDVIIANHMLYHVPNRPAALAKIAGALAPGGVFMCTTNAHGHMAQLDDLLEASFPQVEPDDAADKFGAASGFDLLHYHFGRVQYDLFGGGLDVTDPQAVVDYALSTSYASDYTETQLADFERRLRDIFRSEGSLKIDKAPVLFMCRKEAVAAC